MGINKKEYLQYIKEEEDFNKLSIEIYNKKQDINNKLVNIIIRYIKSLYPQIKSIQKHAIQFISFDKRKISFTIYAYYSKKLTTVLGTHYKELAMPLKYFDPQELKRLKMERMLELL